MWNILNSHHDEHVNLMQYGIRSWFNYQQVVCRGRWTTERLKIQEAGAEPPPFTKWFNGWSDGPTVSHTITAWRLRFEFPEYFQYLLGLLEWIPPRLYITSAIVKPKVNRLDGPFPYLSAREYLRICMRTQCYYTHIRLQSAINGFSSSA